MYAIGVCPRPLGPLQVRAVELRARARRLVLADVCVYIYIYICIHINIYIYIYNIVYTSCINPVHVAINSFMQLDGLIV